MLYLQENLIEVVGVVLGLVGCYSGGRMIHRSYYTARGWYRVLVVLGALAVTPLLATILFYIPFQVDRGTEVTRYMMFIDFIIYAMLPAGGISFLAYLADNFSDGHRPARLLLAASASFAMTVLPIMYLFYAPKVLPRYEIEWKEEKPPVTLHLIDESQNPIVRKAA